MFAVAAFGMACGTFALVLDVMFLIRVNNSEEEEDEENEEDNDRCSLSEFDDKLVLTTVV